MLKKATSRMFAYSLWLEYDICQLAYNIFSIRSVKYIWGESVNAKIKFSDQRVLLKRKKNIKMCLILGAFAELTAEVTCNGDQFYD